MLITGTRMFPDTQQSFDPSRIRTCRRALERNETAQDAVRRIPRMKDEFSLTHTHMHVCEGTGVPPPC